jgi:hypothetical protein
MKPSNKSKAIKTSSNEINNVDESRPPFRLPKYELAESSLIKFKFNDQERELLRIQGIVEDSAIRELEKIIIDEYSPLKIERSIRSKNLSAKKERAAIDQLKKSVKDLLEKLRAINKLSIDLILLLKDDRSRFLNLRQELMAFDYWLLYITPRKDSAGRKEKYDLAYLVLRVAKLIPRYGITVRKRGKQFRAILAIIFGAIGENKKQIRNAVKYAWPAIEPLTHGSARLEE